MALTPYVYGALLKSAELNKLVDAVNALTDETWTAGAVSSVGTGLNIAGDVLSCTVVSLWSASEVALVGDGLDIDGTTLIAAWQAGVVKSIGTGLSLTAGVLENTVAAASGTVTSVGLTAPSIFTVSGSPVTSSGSLTLTAAGTSGGVPYFSASNALTSSAVLDADHILLGGGAGNPPSYVGGLGTTAQVLHGNAAGVPFWDEIQLGSDVQGTLPVANGGTGGTALSAVFVGRKNAAVMQLAGGGSVLADGTYYITIKAPVGFTINSLSYRTGAGSFTANVKIGATSVTGLSAVAVSSSTITTTNASAANTVVADDVVTVVITSATGSPTDVVLQLNITYT